MRPAREFEAYERPHHMRPQLCQEGACAMHACMPVLFTDTLVRTRTYITHCVCARGCVYASVRVCCLMPRGSSACASVCAYQQNNPMTACGSDGTRCVCVARCGGFTRCVCVARCGRVYTLCVRCKIAGGLCVRVRARGKGCVLLRSACRSASVQCMACMVAHYIHALVTVWFMTRTRH